MTNRFSNIFILMISSLLILSCSRGGSADDGPHIINNSDTINPVVEITTPVANQVFANGSSISITGKITDAGGLYRGTIRITNDANGSVIKEQPYEIHGFQLYNFNLSHNVTVTTVSDYTVTVSFEDHGSNSDSKSVKIRINP